jgi:hypothetical protein
VAPADRLVERLHTAVDLWATGVALKRETIRRRHPDASDEEIEILLNRWLQERPGAEGGDGPRRIGP